MVRLCPKNAQFSGGHCGKYRRYNPQSERCPDIWNRSFYIANEGLSITENLAQIGVKIPAAITDRLHVIENDNDQTNEKDEQAAG